jgi:two-component system, OmpR family, sensor kinase
LRVSLALKGKVAAALFAAAIVGPAIDSLVSVYAAKTKRLLLNNARDQIQQLENLEDTAQKLDLIMSGATTDRSQHTQDADQFQRTASAIRTLIKRSTALAGADQADEAQRELQALAVVEMNFRNVISGTAEPEWHTLIGIAIGAAQKKATILSSELNSINLNLRLAILFQISVTVIAIFIFLLWIKFRVVGPLNMLSSGAKDLAEGGWRGKLIARGDPEMRNAILSFNAMAALLGQRRDEIEARNLLLQEEIDERTNELTESNVRLHQMISKRSDFLADISHELRTPLAIIMGEAEVALRKKRGDQAEMRGALERVSGQAKNLTQLVGDLLFIARSEAAAPPQKIVRCDLNDIVATSVSEVRALVEADEGSINFESAVTKAAVRADPMRIAQLLRILIDNAISYSNGPPKISMSVAQTRAGYCVVIRDQGIGICSDELSELFDRFKRGSNAKTIQGNGIGLPLARAIVEAHGGAISIQSSLGIGTVVSFALPSNYYLKAAA